jgi:hypothetical protein
MYAYWPAVVIVELGEPLLVNNVVVVALKVSKNL